MHAFACPHCAALIWFQNSACLTCGSALGFDRESATLVLLDDRPELLRCANAGVVGCNWLAPKGVPAGLCSSCALTRTRPADSDVEAMTAFARAEDAKRRLLFQLDDLGLATTSRHEDPTLGLAFDLLSSSEQRVVTGHDSGVITLDLAEGDDQHRESVRQSLGEPYRTLLGHLRHEIGHWYFETLIEGTARLAEFRSLFGDERQDYAAALHTHYTVGHGDGWKADHISDYAAAHPWEDWAETFAHYLHATDTLQTAYRYGVHLTGPITDPGTAEMAVPTSVSTSPAPAYADFDELLRAWLSVTFALNAVNRSMGKDDLYPFVLVPAVIAKLRFVHRVVTASRRDRSG